MLKDDPCNKPDYRNRRILAEIEQSHPDILCLQEVTLKNTYTFFAHELEAMGYEICATKYVEEEILTHGHQETQQEKKIVRPRYWEILTAFKKTKFQCVDREEIDFSKVSLEYLN